MSRTNKKNNVVRIKNEIIGGYYVCFSSQ